MTWIIVVIGFGVLGLLVMLMVVLATKSLKRTGRDIADLAQSGELTRPLPAWELALGLVAAALVLAYCIWRECPDLF